MKGGSGTNRIDWNQERDRFDLGSLVTSYLGQSPGRGGRDGWWNCPFDDDPGPSFQVHPARGRWKCFGCGKSGDAVDLVMQLDHLSFSEALDRITGSRGSTYPARPCPALRPRPVQPDPPSGLPVEEALALVEAAEARLWGPEGLDALADRVDLRGLDFETTRKARLGWTPRESLMNRKGQFYTVRFLVIPWFDCGRLTLVKIRQPDGSALRYGEAFRDRPGLFPGPDAIEPGLPVVVVEGDFDALLLGQALTGLAAVVTLGAASMLPTDEIRSALLPAPRWYLATDRDDAGEQAAARWTSPRVSRVRPPEPFKDWTEAHLGGIDLRRWWIEELVPQVTPALPDFLEQRWGPGLLDSTPRICNNAPTRAFLRSPDQLRAG